LKRKPIPTIVHPLHPEFRILLRDWEIRGFTIPRGYVWDGASIPGLIRPWMGDPFEGPNRDSGLLHDYLYEVAKVPRAQADELFYRELLADGDGSVEAKLKWSAVRMFAGGHYGSKAEWPKFIDEPTLRAWETRVPMEPLPLFRSA
jgi:hypothetical protein